LAADLTREELRDCILRSPAFSRAFAVMTAREALDNAGTPAKKAFVY
jgi:hypothetical protein